jgi:L-2,4-diaminobutyrate transaminase
LHGHKVVYIASDKIWEVLEQGRDEYGPIGHGWIYSAHPI